MPANAEAVSSRISEHIKSRSQRVLVDFLVTLPFILLFVIQLIHHQMWRDELHVFGEVSASPSLRVLYRNIHYDGHPSLYYLVIWAVTRWVASPAALKIAQVFIGISIYLMIGVVSPFSRLEKILLFLSYFVSFEYTVMSRTYGLCFLLVLIYTHNRLVRPNQLWLNALLLGLIANTDAVGLIISAALASEYGIRTFITAKPPDKSDRGRLYFAAIVYVLLVCFSYWTVKPPADISWRTTGRIFRDLSLKHFASAVTNYIVLPWFPVRIFDLPEHYWNPFTIEHPIACLLALPLIILAYSVLFRRDRDLLGMVGMTALGGIMFGALIYMGSVRSFGVTFMAFLAAFWMQRTRRLRAPTLGCVLLSLSAASGIAAGLVQWTHPFSNAGATAKWLNSHHLQNAQIMGTPDTSMAGLAEELGQPIYFLDCRCSDTFLRFTKRRDDFDESRWPARVLEATKRFPRREPILVLVRPATDEELAEIERDSLTLTPLAQFTGAEAFQEDFYLYTVTARGK